MGWPVDHMSMASSARKRDRGATFVEYALVVAVFTTVLVGAFDVLTRSAGDELASTGDSIGPPYIGTSAGATSTSVPAGPGGSPTPTTPATPPTPTPPHPPPPTPPPPQRRPWHRPRPPCVRRRRPRRHREPPLRARAATARSPRPARPAAPTAGRSSPGTSRALVPPSTSPCQVATGARSRSRTRSGPATSRSPPVSGVRHPPAPVLCCELVVAPGSVRRE